MLRRSLLAAVVFLVAGAAVPAGAFENVNGLAMNSLTANASTLNALSQNALNANGINPNALSQNSLSMNGVNPNALTNNGLSSHSIGFNGRASDEIGGVVGIELPQR